MSTLFKHFILSPLSSFIYSPSPLPTNSLSLKINALTLPLPRPLENLTSLLSLSKYIFRTMKQLIRRLSRVADSSQYCLLRSDSPHQLQRRATSFRAAVVKTRRSSAVPEGHVPVYVGDEMERFVVSAELLNHPIFIKLLNKSAQEYGYEQQGALRIPCHVLVFERVLEALRLGHESRDLQDLLNSLSVDEFQ